METPEPCDNHCINKLEEHPCEQCVEYYEYICELDNSEMDLD